MIPDLHIHEALEGLRALLKDLSNVTALFDKNVKSWFSLQKKLRKKREIQKLATVLNRMTRVNYNQHNIPRAMRHLADNIERHFENPSHAGQFDMLGAEAELVHTMEGVMENVIELREYLEANQSELLERQPAIYDRIMDALYARQEFYEKSSLGYGPGDPIQLTKNDVKSLRELADEYQNLIDKMRQYRGLVATFLKKMDT